MRKSFAVIGLGRFGMCIVQELIKNKDIDVLAIDKLEENISMIADFVDTCVVCDSTHRKDLQNVGISSVDHVVVAIGNNLEASILTVVNLKSLGVKNITVRADELDHRDVFLALGATEVIIPEEASAKSLANRLVSPGVLDFYKISEAGDYSIVTIEIKSQSFSDKSLLDLKIRQNYDITVLCISRDNTVLLAGPNDYLKYKDKVVVFGPAKKIKKFNSYINKDIEEE